MALIGRAWSRFAKLELRELGGQNSSPTFQHLVCTKCISASEGADPASDRPLRLDP
jgi:hypothetical protein